MKRDGNDVSSYYKAWDKFDVDNELEKIEKEVDVKTVKPEVLEFKKDFYEIITRFR